MGINVKKIAYAQLSMSYDEVGGAMEELYMLTSDGTLEHDGFLERLLAALEQLEANN